MPDRDRLSWLAPKRRKTTGSLKTAGQMKKADQGFVAILEGKSGPERPAIVSRPASQPNVPQAVKGTEGGLFYAYVRQDDNSDACYLLTFATAATANEWWLFAQANFPDISRPGPQVFTLRNLDILSETWKHPAFLHLRSKWMYISLSDSVSNELGGAAHGVIPLQDANGNMLGGSAPSSPPLKQRLHRRSMEQERSLADFDARFDRMAQMMERSTDSIDKLVRVNEEHCDHGLVDASAMTEHFGKMTELLARNVEAIENMSKKQFEHEQRLTAALEEVSRKRREDRLDLAQLSAHLDRVNRTLDHSPNQRKDGNRIPAGPGPELKALAAGLDKLQQALEQNSLVNKKILEDRATADAEARYKNQLDLMSVSETLEKIQVAIEKQNLHTNALLEILRDDKGHSLQLTKANGETLDRILQMQVETKEAVEQNGGEIDFGPVAEHMDAIREATAENTEQMRVFIEHQKSTSLDRDLSRSSEMDYSPMTDRLDRMHKTLEKTGDYFQTQSPGTGDAKFLISALSSHMSKIQAVTEQNAQAIRSLSEKPALRSNFGSGSSSVIDHNMPAMIQTTNERLAELVRVLHGRPAQDEQSGWRDAGIVLGQRIEANSAQERELLNGQREMVQVMRDLVLSITAKEKEACDHVVIPPPRKVGRKIVGFVYDAKEGTPFHAGRR